MLVLKDARGDGLREKGMGGNDQVGESVGKRRACTASILHSIDCGVVYS